MSKWQDMIEEFLNYLKHERRCSYLTQQGYGRDLHEFQAFFQHIDSQLSFDTVEADIIRDWMESMMDKGNTATSINRRLSALRSFYRFALSKGLVAKDPCHGVKGPKKAKPLPMFLKEREMDELLDRVEWKDDFKDLRARTILLLFYSTGIRLAELIGLDDESVDFTNRQLKVLGKRDKQRLIPFSDELDGALRQYIAQRDRQRPRQGRALFVDDHGLRMNRNQVQYLVRKHLSLVSTLRKRSPHVLRHTFATAMLNHEANLEGVKNLLGHESLATTQVYTHTTFEQLKKTYDNAHPRA